MDEFNKVCVKLDKKVEELEKEQEQAIKVIIDQGDMFEVGQHARKSILLAALKMVRDIFLEVYNE